jgi:hypothetical protein
MSTIPYSKENPLRERVFISIPRGELHLHTFGLRIAGPTCLFVRDDFGDSRETNQDIHNSRHDRHLTAKQFPDIPAKQPYQEPIQTTNNQQNKRHDMYIFHKKKYKKYVVKH